MPRPELSSRDGAVRPERLAGLLLLRTLVLYAACLALWPVWEEVYGSAYIRTCQWLYGSFGRAGVVRFSRAAADETFDVRARLVNRRTYGTGVILLSSRREGYVIALESALVLATPLPWRRRVRALAWALLLIHLFMAFGLGLLLLNDFSNGGRLAIIRLPVPVKFLLGSTVLHLVVTHTLTYVAVLFVWGFTTLRRGGLDLLLGRPATPEPSRRKTS